MESGYDLKINIKLVVSEDNAVTKDVLRRVSEKTPHNYICLPKTK